MKLKIIEVEASSEDLRQSRTLSDALVNLLRTGLTPGVDTEVHDDEEEEWNRRKTDVQRDDQAEADAR